MYYSADFFLLVFYCLIFFIDAAFELKHRVIKEDNYVLFVCIVKLESADELLLKD